jgi:hypothetical protein
MYYMQKCSCKVFVMVSESPHTLYTLKTHFFSSSVIYPSAHSFSNVLFARMEDTKSATGDIIWSARWSISQRVHRHEGVH